MSPAEPSPNPGWREVQLLVARELGEPVCGAGPLVPARRSDRHWPTRAALLVDLVLTGPEPSPCAGPEAGAEAG